MVDVVCAEPPRPGERVHAGVSARAGGSAVNAALAAASAGASATVVGRVGSDPAAELVLAALASAGVAARLARDPGAPTGAVVSFPGDDGTVVASRGANARFAAADVPEPLDADAVFVSGFALFQEGSGEAARAALDRFTGRWAGIDVGSPSLASVARTTELNTARGTCTVLFATADEARILTGAAPEDAARALAARFTIGCVKLGAEGAIAASGDSVERVRVAAVDAGSPLGAGDAFAGAFLVAVARGEQLERALARACEAGARAAGRTS